VDDDRLRVETIFTRLTVEKNGFCLRVVRHRAAGATVSVWLIPRNCQFVPLTIVQKSSPKADDPISSAIIAIRLPRDVRCRKITRSDDDCIVGLPKPGDFEYWCGALIARSCQSATTIIRLARRRPKSIRKLFAVIAAHDRHIFGFGFTGLKS